MIDPRRTETADLADYHLQVRPGTDAWLLAAMLAIVVEEDLVDHGFLAAHTHGAEEVRDALDTVDIAAYCDRAGVSEDAVRAVARRIASAQGVSIYEDLGIEQAPHSTLNSYLEKLVFLLTGNFAKRGAMNLHTQLIPLFGGEQSDGQASPVTGARDHQRADTRQRDPRRDTHGSPRQVQGDDRREWKPGALARRQPPDA